MKLKSWFLIFILFLSCKDKYMPHVQYPPAGFLVAEGFISASDSPTTILLTRASQLDSIQVIPERGAQLDVQSENGASFPLAEQTGGKYTATHIPVDASQRYRLHIKTSDGKEYLSDLADVKISPPIDSVGFKAGSGDVSIYVSTHDDQKKSQYYQWQFEETWQYNAVYISQYIYNPLVIPPFVPRPDAGDYFYCWNSGVSSDILIASTVSLSSDLVYQFPLTKISYSTSNRLVTRYSILVKQTVLSKEGYEWKQQLKKNTEQLGSIFDAQPSETGGNIHNISDPTERVIGFIGCGTQTEKRIFIIPQELPPGRIYTGYESCMADTVLLTGDLDLYFNKSALLPLEYEQTIKGKAMTGGSTACADCRVQGGTIVKPAFW